MSEGDDRIRFEAPDRFSVATCSCGAPIVWILTAKSRRLALDRAHGRRREDGVLELEPHWAFCPHARAHRAAAEARRRETRRRCYAEGCSRRLRDGEVRTGRPFCRPHWLEVPASIRRWISREFNREDLERGRRQGPKFVEAADHARGILANRARGIGLTGDLFGGGDARG